MHDEESWLELGERLRVELAKRDGGAFSPEEREAMDRVVIALWLRREFELEPSIVPFPQEKEF